MNGIAKAYIELAEDEGKQHALDTAQRAQVQLEELAEIGTETERLAAVLLLTEVNAAISVLIESVTVVDERNYGS